MYFVGLNFIDHGRKLGTVVVFILNSVLYTPQVL